MISSGEHEAEPVHVDAGDAFWRMVRDAPEEDKQISPLEYLLAQHLVISARFHAQMEALLSPHGEYRAARMKSGTRCDAKTDVDGDYGPKALEAEGLEVHHPLCRHLKDVLRCTLVLADHAALGKAHAALLAKHTPVGTKDRRLLPPRDVLQTVWFEGLIVEVQFHFAAGARPQRSARAPHASAQPRRGCPHAAAAPPTRAHSDEPQGLLARRLQHHARADRGPVEHRSALCLPAHSPRGGQARGRDQQAPLLIAYPVYAVWVCGCAMGVPGCSVCHARRPVGKVVYNLELCSDTFVSLTYSIGFVR